EPLPSAVSIHAHEYVHYLHNFSTFVGFQLFASSVAQLSLFASGTDRHGHFKGAQTLSEVRAADLATLGILVRCLRGRAEQPTARLASSTTNWLFGEPRRSVVPLADGEIEVVSVSIDAVGAGDEIIHFEMD